MGAVFLEGVIKTCQKGKQKFQDIIRLREYYEDKLANMGRKVPNARKLLIYMFSQPIINVAMVQKAVGVSYPAANDLVQDFIELGILQEKTGHSRNRYFILQDYVTIFRK